MAIIDKISGSLSKASAAIKAVDSKSAGISRDIKSGVGKARDLINGVTDTADCVVSNLTELGSAIRDVLGLYGEAKAAISGIMGAFQDVPKLLESRFVGGPKDILAVADVYEITEHAVRTRASQLIDSVLKKLLNLARIPSRLFDECFKPILDFFKAVFDFLKSRIEKYLGRFSPGTVNKMGDIVIDYNVLGYAKLDMFWDYRGEIIDIPPRGMDTYDVVTDILNTNLGNGGVSPLATAIDDTAEAVVNAQLITDMLTHGYNPPLGEILDGLSSDSVRDTVCTIVFPTAINPTGLPGPNGNELINGLTDSEGNPITFTAPTTDHPVYTPILDLDPDFLAKPKDPSTPDEDTALDIFIDDAIEDIIPGMNADWHSDFLSIPGINDFCVSWSMCSTITGGTTWSYTAIEELLKHVNVDALFARYPGLIQMLLFFYRLPTTSLILATEYDKLIALIDKLKPSWYRTERNGESIGWLSNLAYSSSDALHLFSSYSGSQVVEESLIASTHRQNDILYLLKNQYPLAAI